MTGSVTGIRRRRTVAGRRETSHLPPDRAFYGQTLSMVRRQHCFRLKISEARLILILIRKKKGGKVLNCRERELDAGIQFSRQGQTIFG